MEEPSSQISEQAEAERLDEPGYAAERERGDGWDELHDGGGSAGLGSFLIGERGEPDLAGFMALVREIGRLLASFSPAEYFQPGPPADDIVVSDEMKKDLGAASLDDFFALAAPDLRRPTAGVVAELFPRGPESLKPVMSAIVREKSRLIRMLARLEKSWPVNRPGFDAKVRPIEQRLDALNEMRANLVRAARLWPRLKSEAMGWPHQASRLLKKARRLQEGINLLTGAAEDENAEHSVRGGWRRPSLTRNAQALQTAAGAAGAAVLARERWLEDIGALLSDMDGYLAVAAEGGEESRDWGVVGRDLAKRLERLENEDRKLLTEALTGRKELTEALEALNEAERLAVGSRDGDAKERAETIGRGVEALWRSVIERRREAARLYFTLPARLGRPVYLDKIYLSTALTLGRAQSLLEELRRQLEVFTGRFSSTLKLRAEAAQLAESLLNPEKHGATLKIAERRFGAFKRTVKQSLALARAEDDLARVSESLTRARETQGHLSADLNESRAENSQMVRQLSAANLEKGRLAEELTAARQSLGEIGLVKARLLKIYERKNALFHDVDQLRRQLQTENELLKKDRVDLRRRQARLIEVYARQKDDLEKIGFELEVRGKELETRTNDLKNASKDLAARTGELENASRELTSHRELLAALKAERLDLEVRLTQTHKELDHLAAERRALKTRLNEVNDQWSAAEIRAVALKAELDRYREELAAASASRRLLGERATALRRRLDLLSQAHAALLKSLRQRGRRLKNSEAESDHLRDRLTRQKKNLLRLVSVRQELRAEIGSAYLRLADLEKERDDLFAKLETSRALTLASDREKATLASELDEIKGRIKNDLGPLINVMAAALWRSESQLKKTKDASTRLQEQFRLESEVREANIRIHAAAREADLTESLQAERRRMEAALHQKQDSLDQAKKRINALTASEKLLLTEKESLATANRELSDAISHLSGQAQKLTASEKLLLTEKESLATANRELSDAVSHLSGQAQKLTVSEKLLLTEKESLATANRELSGAVSHLSGQTQKLTASEKLLLTEKESLAMANRELSDAVSHLSGQTQKLHSAISELKKRYDQQVDESGEREDALAGLVKRQGAALEQQKDSLRRLEPLVEHFLAAAEASEETDSNLLRLIRAESRAISRELGTDKFLARTSAENKALKSKLAELEPLVAFLANAFVANVAELAQARSERSTLVRRLSADRQEAADRFARYQAEVNRLTAEAAIPPPELAAARDEIERLHEAMTQTEATRSILENSLAARESELLEVRSQAYALSSEKEELKKALDENGQLARSRDEEIAVLKKELAEADRDLAENDGRLE
ncbi:MAG: hypothetical protein LBS31_07875, partial [Candidatus Adiutrix sp.]|nr:hypothetical protein [Candidatus Adiutrix sp.]